MVRKTCKPAARTGLVPLSNDIFAFSKIPVLFVHGATNTARTMEPLAAYFREHGYVDDELYATTYGSNGAVDGYHEKMHCEYVKQVCS